MLKRPAVHTVASPSDVIGDTEALLIKAMGLRNIRKMNFAAADHWTQVKLHEVESYLDKIRPVTKRVR